MRTVIDFHSHVLPCVDDGSDSVETSLEMLRLEAKQGIRHVVATPHFYAQYDTPEKFVQRRAEACSQLREQMAKESGLPEVILGSEVYYFPGISNSDALSVLTIAGKSYILLEMPDTTWTEAMYREIEGIYVKQGITPVIAHVDRYIGPFRNRGLLHRLEQLPVMVQANAEFFLKKNTSRMALRLLRDGKIHFLGSDCHNLKSRIPNLGDALGLIEKKLGAETIERINSFEEKILGNE